MTRSRNHYFIYPEDKNGKKLGQTICILMGTDPKTLQPRAYYGIATCSDKDQFSFAIGRELSYNRALEAEKQRKELYESSSC